MDTIIKQIPFYTNPRPSIDSLVVADVVDFNDVIVNCTLPEYCGLEAIIPTSEIKVKRGKAVRNYVKKGQQIVAQVIRIDEQGRVDMSLKMVKEDEQVQTMDTYHKTLKVLQICGAAANYKLERTIELYSLTQSLAEDYESPYKYFEACLVEEATAPTPEIQEAIQKRIQTPSYTCEKEIQLRFSEPNGVERITKQLNEWHAQGFQVFIVSPPKYKIVATANSLAKAQTLLDQATVSS
jgi:translation initiation factor 2 subunit 1